MHKGDMSAHHRAMLLLREKRGKLSSGIMNSHTPYPFEVTVRLEGTRFVSAISYHGKVSEVVRINAQQVLSFANRHYG